jgi:hypothetical protein
MIAIWSFITGGIGKYLFLILAGIIAVGWIRYDAAAPYRAEVDALRQAAKVKDEIIRADAAQSDADRAEIDRLNETLESYINVENSSCVLSDAELGRLRQLAGQH